MASIHAYDRNYAFWRKADNELVRNVLLALLSSLAQVEAQ